MANSHRPLKNWIPHLLSLASDVSRSTSACVTIPEEVLQVATENRKRRSLCIRRKRPVLFDLNGHVALSAAVAVFLKLVNDAAVAKVILVVDVDAVLRPKILPAAQPSAQGSLDRHFALTVRAVGPITEWPGHP